MNLSQASQVVIIERAAQAARKRQLEQLSRWKAPAGYYAGTTQAERSASARAMYLARLEGRVRTAVIKMMANKTVPAVDQELATKLKNARKARYEGNKAKRREENRARSSNAKSNKKG